MSTSACNYTYTHALQSVGVACLLTLHLQALRSVGVACCNYTYTHATCRLLNMEMKGATTSELLKSSLPDRLSGLTGVLQDMQTNTRMDKEVYLPYLA